MKEERESLHAEDGEGIPPAKNEENGGAGASTEQQAGDGNDGDRLTKALEEKTREAAEAQEKYLRTAADFENYRKRMQREMADSRKYAHEKFALELLTVIDHLGLALKHAAENGTQSQGLRVGVQLIYKQALDVLEKFGVKPFAAAGEPFDPARHEAVMQVETDDVPENTVVQVFQDGYLYHDRVLRHAKVSVSMKPRVDA